MKAILRFVMENQISIAIFLLVGTLSAIVNLGSFSLLFHFCKMHYQFSVSIAYILSVIFHFFANRRFSFRNHHIQITNQIPKYLTMIGMNYLLTLFIVHIVVEVMGFTPYFGIVCAIGVTVWTSYILSRFWVFPHGRLD